MSDFKSFEEFRQDIHPDGESENENIGSPKSGRDDPGNKKIRKKKRHPKIDRDEGNAWKRYALITAGVVASVFCIFLFTPVPFGHIKITGNEDITKEDIYFDGELEEPVNILRISGATLKVRLEKDVRIKSVDIDRSAFELHIRITERKPVAIVQEESGYAFLDFDGVVINTSESIRGADLPMITGLKLNNLLLGDRVEKSEVKIALDFLKNLGPVGQNMFSEINMGNDENFIAYTRDGVPVRLAKGDHIAERAKLAENIAGDVKARGLRVEYIDADVNSPYIKMKQ